MLEHPTSPGLGCTLKRHRNVTNPIVILASANADINMAITLSLQAFSVTLILYGRNGATALQRLKKKKKAQKNAKSSHIEDSVTDEHV